MGRPRQVLSRGKPILLRNTEPVMDHRDWIQNHLFENAKGLGFIFVPKTEIQERLARLRKFMKRDGIEAFLVTRKMDYFYLSGTAQDSMLYVPTEGSPLLMVRRELERARVESPLADVVPIRSSSILPELIREHSGNLPSVLGLEMDLLPARDYLRYVDLFPGARFVDGSPIIKEIRKIKSPFEVDLIRKAGEIGREVYSRGKEILREGMSEIEFAGLLEAEAKRLGHEGLLRVRSVNYEAYSWHVLSGVTGGIVSQSDSPMGGIGLSPAFPVGASLKTMKAHEPILVDFGTCYQGYQADETRMFSIGKMDRKFLDAYKACREIHDAVLSQTRPGADCEAIFRDTLNLAEKLGYKDSYLGPPGLQVRFVGHGIGLELGELPYIAEGQSYPLEPGMTFAVEPKIVFPGEGSVGIENTVVVTRNGFEILTPLGQDIFEV
ncbi:MAG: aminopeptidase P family protein [Deltaproteobacteria bacterium HGW-Deltaproteobacteria-21]|nr:MAG: aminopeptidase P family protein [Deltaproteobacteria bacterium HGW-Deltaproteobacteria-21]